MTAKAHAEAVKALITTVRLYEGDVPDGAVLPYAALYMGSPETGRTTLAAVSDWRNAEFQVTSVGSDAAGARWVADRVRSQVLDVRPVITGRRTSPIVQTASQPLRVDRDVTPHRTYLVDVYSFSSVPA